MAFSVYFSTSLEREGHGTTIQGGGGQNIKLQIQRWTPHDKGRKREREGLAGDKAAANLSCRINNYSVWERKGPATPPDHFWCVNTV